MGSRLMKASYILFLLLSAVLSCTLTTAQTGPREVPPVPTSGSLWQTIAPGIERRQMEMSSAEGSPRAVVLRFDPAQVTFRVHYSPAAPRSMQAWRDELPSAAVIVNAGLFDEANRALGLLIAEGQGYGQSFVGFGGMFQVGWDGVRVRSLVTEPYQGEGVLEAAQSFPMLVEVGGVQAPQGDGFDRTSRRTAIAQDRAGRIVLAVIYDGLVSLADLQSWLIGSDLEIWVALALDGGRSTGLDVITAAHRESRPSWSPLPAVIAVYQSSVVE